MNQNSLFDRIRLKIDLEKNDLDDAMVIFKDQIITNIDRFTIILHLVTFQKGFSQTEEQFFKKNIKFLILSYNLIKFNNNVTRVLDKNVKIVVNNLDSVRKVEIQTFYKSYFTPKSMSLNYSEIDECIFQEKKQKQILNMFIDQLLTPLQIFILKDLNLVSLLVAKHLIFFPQEILEKLILNHLNIQSIIRLSETCKYLKNLISNENQRLWKKLYARDFNKEFKTNQNLNNWAIEYKNLFKKKRKSFSYAINRYY